MGIEELASHIFAYDLDRPSLAVAEALARKLWDLGYRRIGAGDILPGDTGLRGVWGQWPGDESIEELLATLKRISQSPECQRGEPWA